MTLLKKLVLAGSLLLCASSLAADVDVFVNDVHWRSYTEQELAALAYPVPQEYIEQIVNPRDSYDAAPGNPENAADEVRSQSQAETEAVLAVSLGELFPLFIDAWELEISTDQAEPESSGGTKRVIENQNLAEELFAMLYRIDDHPNDPLNDHKNSRLETTSTVLNISGEVLENPEASVWISWEGTDLLKEEIARFSRHHDAVIDVLEVPKISSKLVQSHKARADTADLVMVQSDYIYELSGGGMLQPLDYLDLSSYDSKGLHAFQLASRQWAVPFYLDTQLMIGRTDILSRAGCSLDAVKTLEDFERMLEQVKVHADVSPASWNIYSAYWLLPFQFGFGKERLIETDGSVTVNDESTEAAVSYLLHLIERGLLDPFERDAMLSKFVSGDCAVMLSASYMLPELERLGIPFSAAPFPVNASRGTAVAPLLDYKGLAITQRSRNPIAARRLLQYLGGIGVQQRFVPAVHKLPAVKDIPVYSPYKQELMLSMERGTAIMPDAGYSVYKNIMWKMLRTMITGQLSVSEGLDKTQRLISAQMADILIQNKGEQNETTQEHADTAENGGSNESSDKDGGRAVDGGGFFGWLRKLWN